MLDSAAVRAQFPIFQQKTPQGQPLIYLDSAATTQKPQVVIDAIAGYYSGFNANVGRGSYWPATAATTAVAQVREKVRGFINAASAKEVIFTSGTTYAINQIAYKYLLPQLAPGDVVLTTEMEHHANFVPWQQVCEQSGAQFKVVPLSPEGELDLTALNKLLTDKVKMIALTAVSNTLGSRNNMEEIIARARKTEAKVLIDAAQLVSHEKIDVQALDCDFLVFSGHKLYGPTGIGVLYGKESILRYMEPLTYGGGMVKSVSIDKTSFAGLPERHEGGTSNIAGVVGLGAAIDFVASLGLENISAHTRELVTYALNQLKDVAGITVIGQSEERASLISLVVGDIHPHDVASFLSERGIGIRAGHHCTHPLMKHLKLQGTCRVSFGVYNTKEDVDALISGLQEVKDFFE